MIFDASPAEERFEEACKGQGWVKGHGGVWVLFRDINRLVVRVVCCVGKFMHGEGLSGLALAF